MNSEDNKLSVALANSLYSFMALGLLICGLIYSIANGPRDGLGYYIYAIVSEGLVIAVPALLCIRYIPAARARFKTAGISVFQGVAILFASFVGLFFIAMISELWGIFIVQSGGEMQSQQIPMPSGTGEYLLAIAAIALTPAVCEELLVRGVMLPSYEKFGRWAAILLSGALFAVLHGNIVALPGHFLLGVVIGYLVLETGSIAAGIVYHLAHNGVSLTIGYLGAGINSESKPLSELYKNMQGDELSFYITTTVIGMVVLGLIYFGLIRWIRRIARKRRARAPEAAQSPVDIALQVELTRSRSGLLVWLPLIPGLLVAVYLYWFDFMVTFGMMP